MPSEAARPVAASHTAARPGEGSRSGSSGFSRWTWGSKDSIATDYAPDETLIFFEFDDVLFPSTWLREQGLLRSGKDVPVAHKGKMLSLAEAIKALILDCQKYGRVVIVTPEPKAWVYDSFHKFFPMHAAVLDGVKVVSTCNAGIRRSCKHRRRSAMKRQAWAYYGGPSAPGVQNILSFEAKVDGLPGALQEAFGDDPRCRCKTQFFPPRPTISQLGDWLRDYDLCWLLRFSSSTSTYFEHSHEGHR